MSDAGHIEFVEVPEYTGKTKRWRVVAKVGCVEIGLIKWYSGWRQYVYEPEPGSFYEQRCLREIAYFIEKATLAHKRIKAA